jgi:hypothetical protein
MYLIGSSLGQKCTQSSVGAVDEDGCIDPCLMCLGMSCAVRRTCHELSSGPPPAIIQTACGGARTLAALTKSRGIENGAHNIHRAQSDSNTCLHSRPRKETGSAAFFRNGHVLLANSLLV